MSELSNQTTLDANGFAASNGILRVYNYDPESGEFSCATDEFLMQGVGIPANATIIEPPEVDAGHANIFTDQQWKKMPDYRGQVVYLITTGEAMVIDDLGDYPAGTTTIAPATAYDKWDGEKWQTDAAAEHAAQVQEAKDEQQVRIREANSVSQAWQTQLLLNIITDADKVKLSAWMTYVQHVQSVDVSAAPNVEWPSKPSS